MSEIPERTAFVTQNRAAAEQAKALGIPVMTVEELTARLEADEPDQGELTRKDVQRIVAANPELAHPRWVEAELRSRGIHIHVTGERWDPAVPLGAVVRENAERWARIGGAETGDIISADLVNRGKLIDLLSCDTQP